MDADSAALAASVIARGAQQANARAQAGQGGSSFDVWTHTASGLQQRMGELTAGLGAAPSPALSAGSSLADAGASMAAQAAGLSGGVAAVREAQGALATTGAVFGLLTAAEQAVSTALSAIPFPAFPAVRITDTDIGLPHAHSHPPNLTPPNPVPVPLPSTGPVIPIPLLSGASRVLINGMPAARCGDMGMGVWCGGFFPMYEIFLGSSSVWIEGARAARLGVDITKHCVFSTPKPSDPPLGPMIGSTVSSSPNVLIGGVPMPSLTSLAIGAAFKAVFAGVGKVAQRIRAARVARTADEIVPMFSRGRAVPAKPRPQALAELLEEARLKGVEIKADEEAVAYLDWAARAQGIDPANMHAVTLGDDLIMVRPEFADNPRVLREELIHTEQCRAGQVGSDSVVANEIAAREAMIQNADEWGITPEEVVEMQREIQVMRETGKY
jgi:uncharacterized Zn-binding protein involved in type VI secretion